MSALETTVRVNSENQTLILAGEAVPRRSATELAARSFTNTASPSRRPLTLVATPVDDPKLIVQGDFEEVSLDSTALPRHLLASYRVVDRGSAFNAANAYARTQGLSISSAHTAIIDTYA
jgi:hypothetical protein